MALKPRALTILSLVTMASSEGEVEYASHAWRSTSSFTDYSNAVPLLTGVEELIVRSSVSGGARVVSVGGGVSALMLLSDADEQGEPEE